MTKSGQAPKPLPSQRRYLLPLNLAIAVNIKLVERSTCLFQGLESRLGQLAPLFFIQKRVQILAVILRGYHEIVVWGQCCILLWRVVLYKKFVNVV